MPELSAFQAEMATVKLKDPDHQGLIKSQQNWLKQGVEQFALRSIHLLFLFGGRSAWGMEEIELCTYP